VLFDISEPGQNIENIKEAKKAGIIVGIDLGTTNSLVAYSDGVALTFCSEGGNSLIPSVVSYGQNGVIVGEQALKDAVAFRSIKRYMGRSPHEVAKKAHNISDDNRVLRFNTVFGPKTPTEVSAEILKHLKKLAEDTLGKLVERAVITVPAYFDEQARQATKDAARLAGLEVVRILSEPTAAAVAYGFDGVEGGTYAVYDLGGGTFDVSILRMQAGFLQVLATSGNTALGGDDFDEVILKLLEKKYGVSTSISERGVTLTACRMIKEVLTYSEIWKGQFLSIPNASVSKEEFESEALAFVKKTIEIFEQALRSAKVKIADITEVILVGGATHMPLVKKLLAQYVGKEPICSLDPEKVVAIGAARQAYNLQSATSSLLLDVIPLSLKIELADGVAETIISRNTPIPASYTYNFTTQKDGQTGFIIHVLQGESERVDECRSLTRFELKGLPKLKAGEVKLEIIFQIDADGLLSVKAKELATGAAQEILVKPSYGLSAEEMVSLLKIK
jgi:molecular chaperone HscA